MQPSLANYMFCGVMIIAGIGIPVMASLNAALGMRIGAPAAGLSLFLVAALTATCVMGATGGVSINALSLAPKHLFLGGLLVVFYVLSITFIAPKIGVGNAIFLVLLGQIISAVAIDQFGWFGAPKTQISLIRAAGIVLMVAGIYLTRKPNIAV